MRAGWAQWSTAKTLANCGAMPGESPRRKQFLFVDDDTGLLAGIRQLFSEMSKGSWEIFTAENHSQALALLRERSMDVVVLDLDMPVMDGLQFLRLLARTHPGQQVVILTGHATEEKRKLCLENGAALFLEKLIAPDGFAAVFDALEVLANAAPQEGFRGMMRRVGLQEVLQMECLGRKSSVLEIFTGKVRGRIFLSDGQIIHAESGSLQGEVALYGLLGLRGGEFNLRPFAEPPRRTISGQYEFLLMEAARLTDEGANLLDAAGHSTTPPESSSASVASETVLRSVALPPGTAVQIEEVVLCSGAAELLYEWQCASVEHRLSLLQEIEQQAAGLSKLLPAGRFDRAEFLTAEGRIICQVQPDLRLFVRSAVGPGTGA
jgi:DNA-binding NarL/FixJ family response regulator